MKKVILITGLGLLSGCGSNARETPASAHAIGMANPAAVYCQQKGGKSIKVTTEQGERADCLLPSGERIDEWALFHRDHPAK